MQDFVGSYKEGRTPNPCVACNAHVKFHAAAYLADRLGLYHVAIGHYARVAEGPTLARPADDKKDQTYVLWPVPKSLLARTVFPLGEYRKPEVRRVAEERGLAVRSEEHTSELQSRQYLVCRLLLEKKKKTPPTTQATPQSHKTSSA